MDYAQRLGEIRRNMAKAAEDAGRSPASVHLLAVTKTVSVECINQAIDAGVDWIGENRVQELMQKVGALLPCRRDFIGTLQANKAAKLVGKVTMVHSLSKLSAAEALERACERLDTSIDVLIQVNVGGEESKDGVSVEQLENFTRNVLNLKHLRPRGLMTVPPISEGEEARGHFARLRTLLEGMQWVSDQTEKPFDQLSMGMTHDYREAILEGATIVRIGSGLFGEREYQ